MNNRRLSLAFVVLLLLDFGLGLVRAPSLAIVLVTTALFVAGLILAIRFVGEAIRRTIWRLRNRLLVTYVFFAVIPILLILALAAVGTWIASGQVAVYMVTTELERRANGLQIQARLLSQARPDERPDAIRQIAPLIEARLPRAEILLTGDQTLHYPPQSRLELLPGTENYTGYAQRDGHYYCVSLERNSRGAAMVVALIDSALLDKLVPGIGIIDIGMGQGAVSRRDVAGHLPDPANAIDFPTPWWGRLSFVRWDDPPSPQKPQLRSDEALLVIQTRPSAVLSAIFGNRSEDAQTALVLFGVIASMLLAVEAFALVIGVSLSSTITNAVHGLYEGTTKIARGDFSHRIPVKGRDQLAELGNAFNDMTARLQSLVEVAKEKERLQSELEIASEVQNQLFPRSAPAMQTIELIGVCQPARMVSGDYFDYLSLPGGLLAVAIGDVAGKGISAALLMASIQSIMRTQLAGCSSGISTAAIVAQLNRQLYANTSPEKYATFFFGVYDDRERVLTYTNAGHLQPLLIRPSQKSDAGWTALDVTGTVVGAFPAIGYGEESIRIEPGDVLIAYTDGITEPENAYGEEFGADRLAEVAMRQAGGPLAAMAAKIMDAVVQWSAAAEMPDDMTLVIARGLGA